MSDTQIIELDEPEAAAGPEGWRAGSLTLLAVPVLLAAAATWILTSRTEAQPAVVEALAPTNLPRPVVSVSVTSIITAPPSTPSVVTEPGYAELLETQHWTTFGPTYAVRGDVAEAVLDGYAYVIAGSGTSEDGRLVYRYDVRTGERERAPDLPISLDHAMAATLGSRVYVFGGFVFGEASARVFSLGANDARWIEHSPMPAARAAGGAAVLDDRIYLVGGVGVNGVWIAETWAYDKTARWSVRAALPTPRDHLAVGTYRGRVCAAGGHGGETAFQCFDPSRNEWAALPPLRKPIIGGRAVEAAGWFWVVGTDVHVFSLDHWYFGPRLNNARGGHALVAIDGALYVIEGGMGLPNGRMEMLRLQP